MTLFHGLLILHFILILDWYMDILLSDYECDRIFEIKATVTYFHDSVILSYILNIYI